MKTGVVILGVAIVAIGALSLAWHRQAGRADSSPTATQAVQPSVESASSVPPVPTVARTSGCGWSINDDAVAAVHEAYSSATKALGGATPTYVFVLSTVGYDSEVVWNELTRILPKGVSLHGATSAIGVMTRTGLHRGKVGSIAILLVADPEVKVGVGSVDLAEYSEPAAAGRQAILAAYKNAGYSPETVKPKMIILTGTRAKFDESVVMQGMADVVGAETPIVGGDAGDNDNSGLWRQYTRESFYRNGLGVVVTAVFTTNKVGCALENGFKITDREGTVTKANGKIIEKINGRPALDVYDEWLHGQLVEAVQSKDFFGIVQFTGQNPLCRVIKGKSGQIGYVTSHPLPNKDNLVDRHLPVAVTIAEGTVVRLFAGTWQTILNRAEYIPGRTMVQGEMTSRDLSWGVLFFCLGASCIIPESEFPKVPLLVAGAAENANFIGMVSTGEQGPIPGVGNVHANLAEGMFLVGESMPNTTTGSSTSH